MAPSSTRPIFVLGCPRSGTTLLQLMLHSHPRLAIPPETRFVLAAYERRRSFGDLREPMNRRALATWITRTRKFSDLRLPASEVIDEIVAGPPTLGSAFGAVFRSYARGFGMPRWGDKRPAYFRHVSALRRMWPDAQFVHVIRDGRDCVASLSEMPWFKQDVHHAICLWREAIDTGARHASELGPTVFHELRYEDLVNDPAATLTRLCAFLGEDFDPAMTRPSLVARTSVPPQKRWHARTHDEVSTGRVGSWAARLEPWEIALTTSVLGSRLAALGYDVVPAGRPAPARLARFMQVSAHRRLALAKWRYLEHLRRRHEPGPVVSMFTPPGVLAGPARREPAAPLAGR